MPRIHLTKWKNRFDIVIETIREDRIGIHRREPAARRREGKGWDDCSSRNFRRASNCLKTCHDLDGSND